MKLQGSGFRGTGCQVSASSLHLTGRPGHPTDCRSEKTRPPLTNEAPDSTHPTFISSPYIISMDGLVP